MENIENYNVEIHVTYKCLNNCIFCSVKKRKHIEPSLYQIKRGIMNSKGCKRLILSGGEPTLRSDFLDILKYARKYHKRIMVESSGQKNENLIKGIKRGYIDEVRIPIHGHKKYLHDKITRRSNSFDEIVNLLQKLKDFKVKIFTNTVINKLNLSYLDKIVKLIEKKFPFVDTIQISYLRFYEFSDIKSISIPLEKIKPYVIKALEKTSLNTKIILENIPLCIIDSEKAADYDWNIKIFDVYKNKIKTPLDQRIFLKECLYCRKRKKCQGLHNFYFLYYGPTFLKRF